MHRRPGVDSPLFEFDHPVYPIFLLTKMGRQGPIQKGELIENE